MSGVSSTALLRLRKDAARLAKDPVPFISAVPLPANILEWHYVVRGPPDTVYAGGIYHGKLVFPKEYPFKPPSIYMITPNGRFQVNTRLCLSISDYHPDTWNPAWSVGTILTGLLSFMLETAPTLGSVETSDYEKRQYAFVSGVYNLKNKTFRELFPEICKEIQSQIEERDRRTATNKEMVCSKRPTAAAKTVNNNNNNNRAEASDNNNKKSMEKNSKEEANGGGGAGIGAGAGAEAEAEAGGGGNGGDHNHQLLPADHHQDPDLLVDPTAGAARMPPFNSPAISNVLVFAGLVAFVILARYVVFQQAEE